MNKEDECFILENGKKRKAEKFICLLCGVEFTRRVSAWANGVKSKYCSLKCRNEGKRVRVETACYQCGAKISRAPSKMKASKHNVHFCSRLCKEKAQSLDGDCKEIRPPHYLDGASSYRDRAMRNLDAKCKCGVKHAEILSVHHKDGNRGNNEMENLEIVCPTCHVLRHMFFDNGWRFSNTKLTPRSDLQHVEKEVYGEIFNFE